ncbi:MAG: phosphatase PAP2 family protein [Lachnospiraceae bacterium]|nr:phosphatase PAP2 family protein [Lachnospiraceae bacterium]
MDIQYLLWLQEIRNQADPFWEQLFGVISNISVESAIIAIPLLFYWCIDKQSGQRLLLSFSFASLINDVIKLTACIYRPWVRDAAVVPAQIAMDGATGYSFPSGHSVNATSLFMAAGLERRKKALWFTVLMSVFAVLVVFSRNFLGVHTPQDAVVGAIEGLLLYALACRMVQWTYRHTDHDLTVLVLGLVLVIVMILYVALKPYPLDYADGKLLVDPEAMQLDFFKSAGVVSGILVAWFLERRTLSFTVDGTRAQKILRFVIGMAVLLAVNALIHVITGATLSENPAGFINRFVPMFLGIYLIPLCFTRIRQLSEKRKTTSDERG